MTDSNQKEWQDEFNDLRRADGWYGCVVRDGWKKIVLETDEALAYIDPDYKIHQVKEKFGTLRYYFGTTKEGIDVYIMNCIADFAERRSTHTCEVCGNYGELRTKRYYVETLCNSCEESLHGN